LKVVNPNNNFDDISNLKVNINETLDKLVKMIDGGGSLVHNGQKVETPDEITFAKHLAGEGARFVLL